MTRRFRHFQIICVFNRVKIIQSSNFSFILMKSFYKVFQTAETLSLVAFSGHKEEQNENKRERERERERERNC